MRALLLARVLKTGTEFANMKLHKRIDCSRAKGKRKATSWGKSEIENHVVQIKNLFKRWWEENQLQGQEAKAKLRREARSNPEVHTQTEHEVLWKSHRDKIETSLLKKKKKVQGYNLCSSSFILYLGISIPSGMGEGMEVSKASQQAEYSIEKVGENHPGLSRRTFWDI